MWIVKPSYNARGVGIYCSRQISEILPDKKSQQKVVQKYIEYPLLLSNKTFKNRKFDFRQWVLVLSWEPLDVCVFDSCYLKICGQEFDLKMHEDTLRHLSNYSLQKGSDKKDLVMSSDEFQIYMASQPQSQDFTWQANMLPKINSAVWRSLKSLQETQELRQNTFEIYGFDIVLDRDLNPWVIEINLSPACTERADWLSKMLDDSSLDLLNYLQNKILVGMGNDHWAPKMRDRVKAAKWALNEARKASHLNSDKFYEEHQIKNRWTRIPESIDEIKEFFSFQQQQQQPDLQLAIGKADIKAEKRFERQYKMEQSSIVLQSAWRGFLAKKVATGIRRYNAAIVLQKNVRSFLAKLQLIRLRRQKASIIIQRWSRVWKAKAELSYRRAVDIYQRKRKLTVKLQAHWRRKKAVQECQRLRLIRAAIMVQKVMKGYRARVKTREVRSYRVKIVRIQRFYQLRFRLRQRSCVLLQKMMKRYTVRSRVVKELPLFKGLKIAQKLAIRLTYKQALSQLKKQRSAVLIQQVSRRYLARKELTRLRKLKAQKFIQTLGLKLKRARVQSYLKEFSSAYKKNLVFVQKILRSYLAKGKRQMLIKQRDEKRQATLLILKQNEAAIVVQKQLRRVLALNKIEWMRVEDGAACMIQSCWRGFQTRQQLRKLTQLPSQAELELIKQQQDQTLVTQNKGKFVNVNKYQRYVKQIKRELSQQAQMPNQTQQSAQDNTEQKSQKMKRDKSAAGPKVQSRHAQQILEQLEAKKSEIWTKFTQKKKDLKKEKFFPNGRPKQGQASAEAQLNERDRSWSQASRRSENPDQNQSLHPIKLTPMSSNEVYQVEGTPSCIQQRSNSSLLKQTADLHYAERSLKLSAKGKSVSTSSVIAQQTSTTPLQSVRILSTNQATPKMPQVASQHVKLMQQKEQGLRQSNKSFAQSLHEMLEQQKEATALRVNKIMSGDKPLILQLSHNAQKDEKDAFKADAKKINPYLHKNIAVASVVNVDHSKVHQQKQQLPLKSAFQQSFEQSQNKLIQDQVINRTNYHKASQQFKGRADQVLGQIHQANQDRRQSLNKAHSKPVDKSKDHKGMIII